MDLPQCPVMGPGRQRETPSPRGEGTATQGHSSGRSLVILMKGSPTVVGGALAPGLCPEHPASRPQESSGEDRVGQIILRTHRRELDESWMDWSSAGPNAPLVFP